MLGKWIEFGESVKDGPETWEFRADGTVEIIDEGQRMTGTYKLTAENTIQISFLGATLNVKIVKSGAELVSPAGKYRRVK